MIKNKLLYRVQAFELALMYKERWFSMFYLKKIFQASFRILVCKKLPNLGNRLEAPPQYSTQNLQYFVAVVREWCFPVSNKMIIKKTSIMIKATFFRNATYFLLFLSLFSTILYVGATVFIPLTFAILLAFAVLPMNSKLENWGVARWLSALLSIGFVTLLLVSTIALLSYELSSLTNNLPGLEDKLTSKMLQFQQYIKANLGFTIKEQNSWFDKQMKESSGSMGAYVMGFFSVTTTFITNLFLIPILAFFLLLYRHRFRVFLRVTDGINHSQTCFIIGEASKVTQQYLKGLAIDVVILTVLNTLGFWALGLDYALLFAFVAAVLNIVPYIGVIVGSIFPIILALVMKDSIWYSVGVLGVCIFVQFLDNNFIGPKVIGASVSVNPLVATVALLVGSLIWGMAGMVLAIPLAGTLKVFFDNFACLRPYGYLMGEEKNVQQRTVQTSEAVMA